MSGPKIAATAVVATSIAGALLFFATTTHPPIIIGDGSVFMSHDSITASSANEIEAHKLFHKVRTIKVIDQSGSIAATVAVKDRKWFLTNATGTVRIDLRSHTGEGVAGKCPSGWQGTGTYYVCTGDKLTPATLTFTDGQNCPLTGTASCPLSCTSGYCRFELEYK